MSGSAQERRRIQPRNRSRIREIFLGFGLLILSGAIEVRAETATAEGAVDVAAARADAEGPGEQVSTMSETGFTLDAASLAGHAGRLTDAAIQWYQRTPPGDRVARGGLAVCCFLGTSILIERLFRLRERRIIPSDFTAKFLDRLHDGKLDAGRALDYCEENPSPAARVTLAAVRRWGRPAADLERAVALAHRVESDRLTRNVGSLRRVAALAPLVGFLGTLLAAGRILAAIPPGASLAEGIGAGFHWGPDLASALAPLTAGIVIATLAIVAYDGLQARIERIVGALDRLGAETIDAIAMSVPATPASLSVPASRPEGQRDEILPPSFRMHHPSDAPPLEIFGLVRSPHFAQVKSADRRSHRPAKPRTEENASAQG